MIVGMKKITLLCMESHRSATLNALRDLGVLHLSPMKTPKSADLHASRTKLIEARSVQLTLDSYRKKRPHASACTPMSADKHEIPGTVLSLLRQKQEILADLASIRKERLSIEPYGQFDPATMNELSEQGVKIRLYHVAGKKRVVPPEGTHLLLLKRDARGQYFAISSHEEFEFEADEFPLPERSLKDVLAAQETATAALQDIENRLGVLSGERETIKSIVDGFEDEVRLIEAREGMGAITKVTYLQGFCPADLVTDLQGAAAEHGWGIVIDDPSSDDQVPTLIRNPAWVRPINILFSMLDILPGYHEVDIRSAFLVFFALFFAVLVGDAGYGLIFLLIAGILRLKMKDAPPEPFRLVFLLSICTIVWGAITGNYFGIAELPAPLRGLRIPWMMDERNLIAFSFLVGAIHLTIARAWAALKTINSTRALGQVGWICLSWTMYFLARNLILGIKLPGFFAALFISGMALLVLFMTPFKLLKAEWADHVMLPFDVIGNFADLVSYVRLFAVGSAGLAVAVAFNELAIGKGIDSWVGGLKAVIVLFLGHALNIILCLMSILVHGVRLNTLEFSRHVGLEWAGVKYNPFARCAAEDQE